MMCRISRIGAFCALAGALLLVSPARGADAQRPAPRRPRRADVRRDEEVRPQVRARRPAAARPREQRDAPDRPRRIKPTIIQFEHISAESFMHTLKQLARNPHVAQALRELPLALNEEANAVVVIAPDEVTQMLTAIARGLDRPSEYHQREEANRRREHAQRARMALALRRGAVARVARPPAEAGMRREARRAPGDRQGRTPMHLGRLLLPDAVRRLKLSPQQVREIRAALEAARASAQQLRRRIAAAGAAPEDEYRREAPEMRQRVQARVQQIQQQARREVFSILTPEQRDAAERLLEQNPAGPPPREPRPLRPGVERPEGPPRSALPRRPMRRPANTPRETEERE
jgi:hypothetical protein